MSPKLKLSDFSPATSNFLCYNDFTDYNANLLCNHLITSTWKDISMTDTPLPNALDQLKAPVHDEHFNLIAHVNSLLTLLSVSQSNAINRVHAKQGIKLTPLSLLYEIVEHGGMATQTALAERFPYTKQAMTLAIDNLVTDDLVYRQPNKIDKRVKNIIITPKGMSLVKEARDIQRDFYDRFAQVLTWEEMSVLLDLLRRVNNFYKSIE